VESFIKLLRRKPWARRSLSGLSVGLLCLAVGLLGYPVYTNLYQDWFQNRLRRQMASPELRRSYQSRTIKVGQGLTRIKIAAIDVDTVVVEGTTPAALRAGAGHYPETPLPCEDGNVGIAGHRTTYGKPFANLDRLKPGDTVILTTPIGQCTYQIDHAPQDRNPVNDLGAAFIVLPTDLSVVAPDPSHRELTLTSCHPKHSASRRIVVQAHYVSGKTISA
jgi:sortase A